MSYFDKSRYISELLGKTLISIDGLTKGSEEVKFATFEGDRYEMYHVQDCCERVVIDDINGSINDLIGFPITLAEESTNNDNPPEHADSWTWTFYRLATVKGYVDIKWLGESNGYYSEGVSFIKV